MGDSSNYPLAPPSLKEQVEDYNLAMLYYGGFVVATAGVVLVLYHCLVIKWCVNRSSWPPETTNWPPATTIRSSSGGGGRKMVVELELALASTSYKYAKGDQEGGGGSEECAVCLSMFEEGEDVRELPRCKHSFHAPCIDMWLSSHFDCPLCRAPVCHYPTAITVQ